MRRDPGASAPQEEQALMVRLHGFRERIPVNVYDAVSPRRMEHVPASVGYEPTQVGFHVEHFTATVFNQPRNIGDPALTNLQTPGYWSPDQTLFLKNWYGRTNMILGNTPGIIAAFDAWMHATTATFVLGCAPLHQVSLFDLMGRWEGMDDDNSVPTSEASWFPLAHELRAAHAALPSRDFDDPSDTATWPREQLDAWHRVVMVAAQAFRTPYLAIVPIRQNFRVELRSDARAHKALLEVLPTDIAPMSLVWVHLEGVAMRDVA